MHFPHSGIAALSIVQMQQLPHVEGKAATTAKKDTEIMAYTAQTQTRPAFGGFARFDALLGDVKTFMARRSLYRATLRELSMLSNRELADLGLSRSEIKRVALEASNDI